ncbi:MAG: hypothetical protein HY788_19335 [Deltaproteobacteria bacterium]|nr:hypothetical protein [Deltaproteobacteria bacterium]
MDLRLRFGMKSTEYTERTCIIVVGLKAEPSAILIGIVVGSDFPEVRKSLPTS